MPWVSRIGRASGLFIVAVVVGTATVAMAGGLPPGGTFTDDDGNTHEGNIEAIAAAGITQGCDASGTLYCPADNVTRGQMASFIARALSLPAASADYFTDDDTSTHQDNINRLREAGVTLGCDTSGILYCPDDPVTRAQMASFLARALSLAPAIDDYFSDDAGNTHEVNINAIAEAGITAGCEASGTLYCPADLLRRDQMASFLARALDLDPIIPPPPATTTTTEPATPTTFGEGVWVVGSDISAGTYRNSDSSGFCYWARLSGFSGDIEDIITNEFTDTIQIVEISSSDAGFESNDCGIWSTDLSPRTTSPDAAFGEGTYLVGSEVAPGLWRNSDSSDFCYWERRSGFSGELDDIITNEFSDTIQTVQIMSTDVGFFSNDCGTWTKIG